MLVLQTITMTIHDIINELEYEAQEGELHVLYTWALTLQEYIHATCEKNPERTFIVNGLDVLIFCGMQNINLPRHTILEIWEKVQEPIKNLIKQQESNTKECLMKSIGSPTSDIEHPLCLHPLEPVKKT